MNQGLNLNEYVEIAQKKFPSFVIGIVAFNSAEVWSNTNILIDLYLIYFKPFKVTKLFIILKLLIHGNLPCHSSSTDENEEKPKFIKPECHKLYE